MSNVIENERTDDSEMMMAATARMANGARQKR